jgi:hypothetical protein
MTITVHIDPSWVAAVPHSLARVLTGLAMLERPRAPGDDADDLATLLDGLLDDAPEPALAVPAPARPSPAPSPAPAPSPRPSPAAAAPRAARRFDGEPTSGRQLYRWAIDRKMLPKVNAAGKRYGYGRLVSDWSDDQAVGIYRELTMEPSNGRTH